VLGRRRCTAALMAFAAIAALANGAYAANDYPNKPVRILVPYGPGGAGDLTIRLLANKLSQNLKQPFVIENRPGAGGIAAMRTVLSSPADGYTLGEIGNGQTISMSLFQGLPYNVLKDFAPISVAASFAVLLAVPPNSPYKSVRDVIDAARKAPGKLNLGAINPGSTQNLSAHLFQQVSNAEFTIVTYRTTPDLVTALLRAEVDLGSIILPAWRAQSVRTSCTSSPHLASSAIPCSKTCRPQKRAGCPSMW
jgi:tripartite-type tricarboxylate transporter receptor subunit TctC